MYICIMTNKELEFIKSEAEYWFGIKLHESDLTIIQSADHETYSDMIDSGFDTVSRGRFINAYIKHVLKMNSYWPLNGDTQEYKDEFFKEFKKLYKNHIRED